MKYLIMMLCLVGMAYAMPVQAQDSPKEVVAAGAMDTNNDGKVDNEELNKEMGKEVGVGDVASDVTAVVNATQGLKDKNAPKAMVWMLILATIFKLALSAIKMVKKSTNWFHAKKAKRIIKYTTLGLGAIAALLFNLIGGMGWMDAGLIFLAGPVSVAIHEYTKDSKDGDPDAGTAPAGTG